MDTIVSFIEWLDIGDKGDEIDTRVLGYYLRPWGFMGFWPDNTRTRMSVAYYYPRFILAVSYFSTVWYIFSMISISHNVETLTEHMFLIFYFMTSVIKLHKYIYRSENMTQLCRHIEKLHKKHKNEATKSFVRTARVISKFISHYFLSLFFFYSLIFIVGIYALAIYKRRFVASTITPCDTSKTHCFLLKMVFEVTSGFCSLNCIAICDALIIDFLAQTLYQFKILNHNLLNIKEDVILTINQELTEVNVSPLLRDEVRVDMEIVPGSWSPDEVLRRLGPDEVLFPRNQSSQNTSAASGREKEDRRRRAWTLAVERGVAKRLESCVRHHQHLIRIARNLEEFFGTHLLCQVGSNLSFTTLLILYCSVIQSVGMKEIGLIHLVFLSIFEFYLFCLISNEITQESSNVRDSIYGCDWLDSPESFKRSMRVIISRSNEPVVIRAGGFVPISIETFYAVTNQAFSYFMALRTINEKLR